MTDLTFTRKANGYYSASFTPATTGVLIVNREIKNTEEERLNERRTFRIFVSNEGTDPVLIDSDTVKDIACQINIVGSLITLESKLSVTKANFSGEVEA